MRMRTTRTSRRREMLRRPVHVPFRAKKDPRDIRVLDPACGSGHFLLYAFDLLVTIYEEAWERPGVARFRGDRRHTARRLPGAWVAACRRAREYPSAQPSRD